MKKINNFKDLEFKQIAEEENFKKISEEEKEEIRPIFDFNNDCKESNDIFDFDDFFSF